MNYNGSSNNIMIAFKNNKHAKNREMDGFDIVSNPLYLRRFAALLREVTQKGSDLMHLPNGNVIITETKVVTYQYAWNQNKGRFERAKINLRSSKAKKTEEKDRDHTETVTDEYYEETEDEVREDISNTNIDELV